jgi:hypothetical protein
MNDRQLEKMLHLIIWLLIFVVGVQFGIKHGRDLQRHDMEVAHGH